MTARSYLSIGDVLTLLREEFPDVTISKIRFLESQGLVNPERSPSGYRKFFETDVERLRWVLRQQREHFLPLKVIRDRLDAGDLGEEESVPSETETHGNGRVPQPAHAGAGARASAAARAALGGPAPAPAVRHRHRDGATSVARTVARAVVGAVPGRRPGDGADSGRRISPHYPCSRGRRPADRAARHPGPIGARPSGPQHPLGRCGRRGRRSRCSRCGRCRGGEQRRTRHRAVGPCGGACCPGPDRGDLLARLGTPATTRPYDVGCHATRVGDRIRPRRVPAPVGAPPMKSTRQLFPGATPQRASVASVAPVAPSKRAGPPEPQGPPGRPVEAAHGRGRGAKARRHRGGGRNRVPPLRGKREPAGPPESHRAARVRRMSAQRPTRRRPLSRRRRLRPGHRRGRRPAWSPERA